MGMAPPLHITADMVRAMNGGRLAWSVDPDLFHLGPLTIRWYGLFFALGLLLSNEVGRRIFEAEGQSRDDSGRLLWYVAIGTIVGARLGHCLLYEPGFYLSHPLQILYIWRGGLASHGGVVGIIVAVWMYARRAQRPFLWVADRVAVVAPIAAACIRLGNLFNSEIVGRPSNLPWAIVFTRVDALPRHPTQLYEALAYALIGALTYRLYRRTRLRERPGFLLGLTLVLVFTFRLLIEFVKEPQEAFEAALPLDLGQLLSLPLIVVGLILMRPRPAAERSPHHMTS
jgi:phosphatidylglycerol---prolipoprotein diacylglyceryl transferase